DIVERSETGVTIRWPAGVPKRARLKGAATRVPQIARTSELQCVDVGADREVLQRPDDRLAERVTRVHQVEEGQPRVDTWCREQLEKGAMRLVGGVVVARALVVATSQPRRK